MNSSRDCASQVDQCVILKWSLSLRHSNIQLCWTLHPPWPQHIKPWTKFPPFALAWITFYVLRFKFQWALLHRIQFKNNQHWSEWWLGAKHVTDHYLSQWWPGSRTHIGVTKHRWVKPTQESLCITVPLGDGMQNYQIRILSVSANSWEIPFTLLIILKHFKAFLCLREKATFPHWDFGPEHSLNAEMNFVAP